MKRAKHLTREQKECVLAHYLNVKQWELVEEMDFYLKVINKETGKIRFLDKFRRIRK